MGSLVAGQPVWAQFGGRSSYEFLNIPTQARLAALGGVNVSHYNKDVNFFFSNPALVSDSLAGWASGSYLFYVADIGQTSFAYTHDFKSIGAVSFGVQHIDYGDIEAFDATGSPAGQFKSGETALVISKSHRVSHFRLGANLKTVFSNLAGFRSSAVMLDLGGVFVHPQQELTIGLSLKNLGLVLMEYSQTSDTKLPFDVQAGVTFKPEHMPLRFSVTVYNLVRPGKLYDDPNDENKPATLEKVMSHLNFGTEVLLHRHVQVLAGYNFSRQKELKVQSGGGGSGFTFGLAAKIKSVDLVIGSSRYGTGNANYTVTIATNINQLRFKKTTIL
jgi:hypothetical protein